MAKYKITHECGHVQVHKLFGPEEKRETRFQWLMTQKCEKCLAEDNNNENRADFFEQAAAV